MSTLSKIQSFYEVKSHESEEYFNSKVKGKETMLYEFIGNVWRKRIKKMVVLNVGCGPFPLRFGAKKEIGLDPLNDYYSTIYSPKLREGMDLVVGIAEDMDIKSKSVGFVYCISTIEYIQNWRAALNEIHRVLKKRGHLFMFYNSHQEDRVNLNLLSDVDMKDYLESIGFVVLKYNKDSENHVKVFGRKI